MRPIYYLAVALLVVGLLSGASIASSVGDVQARAAPGPASPDLMAQTAVLGEMAFSETLREIVQLPVLAGADPPVRLSSESGPGAGAVPTAPTLTTATALSTTFIQINWNDNSSDETGFKILRFNGSGWPEVGSVGANIETFTDTGRSAGTLYFYWMYAFNGSGNTFAPVPVSAYTQGSWPAAPTLESATGASQSSIRIKWADNSSNENAFKVMRFNGSSWPVIATLGANTTTYVDTGLAINTSYYYWVLATNTLGDTYAPAIIFGTTFGSFVDTQALQAQTGTSLGLNHVSFTWTNPNVVGQTQINIRRFDGSGWPTIVHTLPSNSTEAGLSGAAGFVETGLNFYWITSLISGVEHYAPSPIAVYTTEDWPASPAMLSAVGTSSTGILLSWKDNSANETGFKIFRSTGGAWTELTTVPANTTSLNNGLLSPSTTYYYWVWAINASGVAYASNIIFATTWPP